MTLKELKTAYENGDTTVDEVVATLDELGLVDDFIDSETTATMIEEHSDDLQWISNFIEDADFDQEYHHLDGYGWIDDRDFDSDVEAALWEAIETEYE